MPSDRVLWMSACPMSIMSTWYFDKIAVTDAVSPGLSTPLIRININSVLFSMVVCLRDIFANVQIIFYPMA